MASLIELVAALGDDQQPNQTEPLDFPNSSGWWWARSKEGWLPGDELCLEVMMPGDYAGLTIYWRGESLPISHFENMEWRKVQSPWPEDQVSSAPDNDLKAHLVGTRFQFAEDVERHNPTPVSFDRMESPFYEGTKWAVREGGSVLAKDGTWWCEPIPSSRDEEFYAQCRFDSLDHALHAYALHATRSNDS